MTSMTNRAQQGPASAGWPSSQGLTFNQSINHYRCPVRIMDYDEHPLLHFACLYRLNPPIFDLMIDLEAPCIMPSAHKNLKELADAFMSVEATWDIEKIMGIRTADCTHQLLPRSLGHPSRNNEEFKSFYNQLVPLWFNYKVGLSFPAWLYCLRSPFYRSMYCRPFMISSHTNAQSIS